MQQKEVQQLNLKRELTEVLHVVVVGPSVDVQGDDFHKPRQQDNK